MLRRLSDREAVREPRNSHANVRPLRPIFDPPPTVMYDQDADPDRVRSDDVVTIELQRWQKKALLGVLAHVGTPEARDAMSWLSPHPSLMGPRNGGAA